MTLTKKILAIGTGAILASALNAKADGRLDVTNHLNGVNGAVRVTQFTGMGSTDGLDNNDATLIPPSINKPAIYSSIPGNDLRTDTRDPASNTPFILHTVFNGTISSSVTNYLRMGFSGTNQFQHKPYLTLRLLDTNGVPTTNAWDLKYVIANQNGTIPLQNVPAGTYNLSTPVQSFQIDFNPVSNWNPVASNSSSFGNKVDSRNDSFNVSDNDGIVTNVYTLGAIPGQFNVDGTNWTWNPQGITGSWSIPFYVVDNQGALSSTNYLNLNSTNRTANLEGLVRNGNKVDIMHGNVSAVDPDGELLSLRVLEGNTNKLSVDGLGYAFNPSQQDGQESYVVVANDGTEDSSPATLQFTATNRAPFAANLTNSVNASASTAFNSLPMFDEDGDELTYTLNSNPVKGNMNLLPQGIGLYTAHNNEHGKEVMNYSVTDGFATNSANLVINVNPVNRDSTVSASKVANGVYVEAIFQPNRTIAFQRSTDLSDTNSWQTVFGPFNIPNSPIYDNYVSLGFIDTAVTNTPRAFYRLNVTQPSN